MRAEWECARVLGLLRQGGTSTAATDVLECCEAKSERYASGRVEEATE